VPGGMPYHYEKGPFLSILEDDLNGTTAHLVTQLDLLRGGSLANASFFQQPQIATAWAKVEAAPPTALADHVFTHWFGSTGSFPSYTPQPSGPLTTGQLPPASGPQTTGFWSRYYGDVEGIVRLSLRRAVEVALGVDTTSNAPVGPGEVRRQWPIEVFWVCGLDRFEGYVMWRCDPGTGGGQVNLVFVTPPTPDVYYDDLVTPGRPGVKLPAIGPANTLTGKASPVSSVFTASAVDPADVDAMQGMWLVSPAKHRRCAVIGSAGTFLGQFLPAIAGLVGSPSTVTVAYGTVGTFVPAFGDGGVLPFGFSATTVI
jgi:hypothetical protein